MRDNQPTLQDMMDTQGHSGDYGSPRSAMPRRHRAGLYPFPVYEALLSNGEEVRLSFWSPANKPIDMEAGRRAIMATSAALSDKTQWVKEADGWHNRYIPKAEIICGYVEHASIGRVEDKLESAPQRRKAVNWRKALADIRTSLAAGKADFALSQLDAILAG